MNLIQRFVASVNNLLDTAEQASRSEAAAVYVSMSLVTLAVSATAVLMLIAGVHLASTFLLPGSAFVAPCLA